MTFLLIQIQIDKCILLIQFIRILGKINAIGEIRSEDPFYLSADLDQYQLYLLVI